MQKADVIIAVSEVTKSDIISHYGISSDKIQVIPVATPKVTIAQTQRPHDNNYILCISSFLGRKSSIIVRSLSKNSR